MDKHLYREIYVVGTDSAVSSAGGELTVCSSFESLLNHLKTKNVSINSDLRVLHGVLTSACSIPKDFRNRQPFLLIRDPEDNERGILLDADSDGCRELAMEIEKVLGSEEIATFFIDIEHVYILYGYELNLALSVDEDDLDEEIIIDCIEVGDAARELNEDN
jgi:hypothetical protein